MSRPTLVRAIKVLIQRGMIRRLSRQGATSYYALTDKENWISFSRWSEQQKSQPGKPENHLPGKPQNQGVVNERAGGGSVVYTKNTHEEYTEERETSSAENPTRPKLALVSSVEENPTSAEPPFSPNDDFSQPVPKQEWTIAERFVLKACYLWDDRMNQESPAVEANWKTKQAVRTAGSFVAARLDVAKRIGGTPTMFLEFWHDTLKRSVAPRPDYVVEQWAAYDRWLIENHETHRRSVAA
jgi:hypothetical protein